MPFSGNAIPSQIKTDRFYVERDGIIYLSDFNLLQINYLNYGTFIDINPQDPGVRLFVPLTLFLGVNVRGRLSINDIPVLASQQPSIADITYGATNDQIIDKITEILQALRAHGLIAS